MRQLVESESAAGDVNAIICHLGILSIRKRLASAMAVITVLVADNDGNGRSVCLS